MKNIFFKLLTITLVCFGILTLTVVFCSCKSNKIPETIKLYNTESQSIETLDFNKYIESVVFAEIGANTPLEAIKAQAVLARTFVLDFIKNNKSKYEGADISNDITEALAYKQNTSTDVKNAVKKTKNEVVKYNGELIKAYFFANSGGVTASPKEGLSLVSENYPYLKSVKSPETAENSKSYSFSVVITKNQVLNALRTMGISVASITSFEKGETGESGRCISFIIGGKEVNANTFRLTIGSTLIKSTLIDNISISGNNITLTGRGYGHGVGLSQEGAIVLANNQKTYKEIINYYFENVEIVKA